MNRRLNIFIMLKVFRSNDYNIYQNQISFNLLPTGKE